jgi:hypothetical protein
MSEYQYYEFQAIDRPLSEADREALRALSTRARITATSFTNSYEWGDFKGDPAKLMERWFDLHLYFANWGSRRLMVRLPKRLVDRHHLDAFLREVDCAELSVAGENLILDISRGELQSESWDEDSDEDRGWLSRLAPLRADVLGGDLRLFYLIWLTAVEADRLEPDEQEPLPGIGPMTGALEAFADFFDIDGDLVAAAAERSADTMSGAPASPDAVRRIIAAIPEEDKNGLLARLCDGDVHVMSELRVRVRDHSAAKVDSQQFAARTVGELRLRADAIRLAREQAKAEKAAAERKRREEADERARRIRLDAMIRRGESVWREIETEIERRNPGSYDRAINLLVDLQAIAEEKGTGEDFSRRLRTIRERHARKERFVERLGKLGSSGGRTLFG